MGTTMKLVCGSRVLDLADGTNYAVAEGWHPPMTGISSALGGNVRNVDGKTITQREAQDRRIAIPIILISDTPAGKGMLARKVNAFIAECLSGSEKLYLHMRGDSITDFEPIWGQFGASLRLWVKDGGFSISSRYGSGQRNSNLLDDNILELTVSPVGYGSRQVLAGGTGTIIPVRYGRSDPFTRGIILHPGAFNRMTNPIFGHGTWNNDWTAGSAINDFQNTNEEFIFYGENSAHLVNNATTTANSYAQSITSNTSQHTLSFMCKKPDGSAVTASDVRPLFGTGQTDATYVNLGNGWYWVFKTLAGAATPTDTGCIVLANKDVYVDAFQFEQTTYPTWPIHGDMLDVAWTSTAHASTSTSTAARMRLTTDNFFNNGRGTLTFQLRHLFTNAYPSNYILYDDSTSDFRGFFQASDDKFYIDDATNNEGGAAAAQSYAAGDTTSLSFVWGEGLAIYQDGAVLDSGTTHDAPTLGTYIYIGSNDSAAGQFPGIIQGVQIYDHKLTAAVIASKYAEFEPIMSANERVDWMPVFWTDDGDNTLDSLYSASDENFGVAMDIPGDHKALTEIYGNQSSGVAGDKSLYLANMDTYEYLKFGANLFFDQSSKVTSVDSATYDAITNSQQLAYKWADEFNNREWYGFVRFTDAGSENLLAYLVIDAYQSADQSINDDDLWTFTAPVSHFRRYTSAFFPLRDIYFRVYAKRTSGSAANVTMSYFMLVPSPLIYLDIGTAATSAAFWYQSDGGYVDAEITATPTSYKTIRAKGGRLEFVPDKYNTMIYSPVRTSVELVVNNMYVTPRWGLTW